MPTQPPPEKRVALPLSAKTTETQLEPPVPAIPSSVKPGESKEPTKAAQKPPEKHEDGLSNSAKIMNAVIENRPYHEIFMREAINMVSGP